MPRVLVVGTGPAGLLASMMLARSGCAVDAVDPVPGDGSHTRPQSRHVHLWSSSAWQRLVTWLPDLEARSGISPQRAMLDQALWTLCHPYADTIYTARITELDFRADQAYAKIGQHWLAYDLVLDASGAARSTIANLAIACGEPLPLDNGPPSGGYVTFRLQGLYPNPESPIVAARDPHWGGGAILRFDAEQSAQLTLQAPAGAAPPSEWLAALRLLADFEDSRIFTACCDAWTVGEAVKSGGRPPARLALEAVKNLPDSWMPLGDCLLTTPPYLGHGFDQLTEQVEMLSHGLDEGLTWAQIRSNLAARARQRWWAATWIETLRDIPSSA